MRVSAATGEFREGDRTTLDREVRRPAFDRLPKWTSQREPVEVGVLVYPFSAVVGSDDLALALTLCAVSPSIGGVLVRGEKGTAKSTMVRAQAALLPQVAEVEGCRFACDPSSPDPHCPDGPHPPDTPSHIRPARLVEFPVARAKTASPDPCTWARPCLLAPPSTNPGCSRSPIAACCTSTK